MSEHFIPPHGGCQALLEFRKARVVYGGTVRFCLSSLSRRDRTIDQMVQAARPGRQNILEDYRDILITRGPRQWDKDGKEALFVRRLGARRERSHESYRTYIETRPPEVVANILIRPVHQANYLLDQPPRRLEQDFLAEGGLRERMARARLDARNRITPRISGGGRRPGP